MEPVTSTHVGDWPASLFLNQNQGGDVGTHGTSSLTFQLLWVPQT